MQIETEPIQTRPTQFLDRQQMETVAAIGELIIPQTATPGARAARVEEFIDNFLMTREEEMRREFLDGLARIDKRSRELYGKNFTEAASSQQTELLTHISRDESTEDESLKEFFKRVKSLTVLGYYTSREGMLEELGYEPPGCPFDYQGCTHPEHKDWSDEQL